MRIHFASEDGSEGHTHYLCGRKVDHAVEAKWTWQTPQCKQCIAVIDREEKREREREAKRIREVQRERARYAERKGLGRVAWAS